MGMQQMPYHQTQGCTPSTSPGCFGKWFSGMSKECKSDNRQSPPGTAHSAALGLRMLVTKSSGFVSERIFPSATGFQNQCHIESTTLGMSWAYIWRWLIGKSGTSWSSACRARLLFFLSRPGQMGSNYRTEASTFGTPKTCIPGILGWGHCSNTWEMWKMMHNAILPVMHANVHICSLVHLSVHCPYSVGSGLLHLLMSVCVLIACGFENTSVQI